MRLSLFLFSQPLLLLGAACGGTQEVEAPETDPGTAGTTPFVYHVVDGPSAPLPALADDGPELELVEIRREDEQFPIVVLRLVNDTDSAWTYHAYVEGTPLTMRQVLSDGSWRSAQGWCGTGLMEFELRPGGALRFEDSVWGLGRDEFRLAVPLETTGEEGERLAFDAAVQMPRASDD